MRLPSFGLGGRSRMLANLSVVGVASAAFLVVATNADGYKATNVDLNDGTVWVTNVEEGKVGRLNVRTDELDFALTALNGPEVVQEARSVLIGDAAGVQTVDVRTGAYEPPKNVIRLVDYQIGGGKAALLDSASGKLWTGRSQTLVAPEYPKKASGQVPVGSELVVTTTGRILIVDPTAGVWFEVETDASGQPVSPVAVDGSVTDGSSVNTTADTTADTIEAVVDGTVPDTAVPIEPAVVNVLENEVGEDDTFSAVGDDLVFLSSAGEVFGPEGEKAQIPGEVFALQAPGPKSGKVLVASDEGLFAVEIGSDSVEQLSDQAGVPAPPARVASCAYGAWAATVSTFFKKCAGEAAREDVVIDGATADDHLVFRVNQNNVAINSTGNGGIWAEHDGRLVTVGNWGDLQGEQANDDSTDTGNVGEQEAERVCADDPQPPTATEDPDIGIRANATIFDVLGNDSDPNCEPIAVATLEPSPETPGQVFIVDNGQHVMFAPSVELRDGLVDLPLSFTFAYSIADSANMLSAPVTATVFITDPAVTNSPPQLRTKGDGEPRKMRTVVESGKSVSYDVLTDWWDAEGDELRLVSATTDVGGGEITFSPAGIVGFKALGVQSGIENVSIRVSDGNAVSSEATGELEITVLPQGQAIKPVAKDDFVTLLEGSSGVVHPLLNDSDGNGSKMTATIPAIGTPPPGLTATYDTASDTLTVIGLTAGVYAIPYQASDGVDSADAVVRVVVTSKPAENAAPVAVPDRVVVRPGRVINVDVLTNDIDADGDLLAVVAASAGAILPDTGGIRVSVVDRRVLQIELVSPTNGGLPTGPFFVSYSIDDGNTTDLVDHRSNGLLTVLVDLGVADQAPVAVSDSVNVRTGDIASIAVTANDIDADGDRIVLTSVKADEAAKFEADGGGVVWTDKQVVRVRGGVPATYVLHYEAVANDKKFAGELTVTVKDLPNESNLNQAPKPANLQVRAARGTTVRVAIPVSGIDPDGDSVSLSGVGATEKAAEGTSVQIDPADPTRLLYSTTPQSAVVSDVFSYTVVDSFKQTSTATVHVVIVNVEASAPVAHDDVMRAKPGRVVLMSVLSNDVDADDDRLSLAELPFLDLDGTPTESPQNPDSVSVVVDEEGGAVTGGRFEITVPFADQPAITERYQITDGANFADAYVRVIPDEAAPNLAPIAGPDAVTAEEARGLSFVDVDVLLNDFDPDDAAASANGTLKVTLPATQAMPGVVASVEGSKVRITLADDAQVVVYRLTDLDPDQPATAFGVIRVPGLENHAPIATAYAQNPANFAIEASPPEAINFDLAELVEDPDLDPGVVLTDTEILSAGTGVVERTGPTTFTFTPNTALEPYTAQVTFEVEDRPGDDKSLRALITVNIPVSPGNTPPVSLSTGQVSVPQYNEPVAYDLAKLIRDDQNDPLQFVLTDQPQGFDIVQSNGKLTITSTDKKVSIGASFSLRFTVTDGVAGHDPVDGVLNITVTATNRGQPVAANIGPLDAIRDEASAGVNVIAQSTNPFPEDPLTIESVTVSGAGSVGCSAACGQSPIVFTPTEPGSFTVNYSIKDAVGQVATGTVTYVVKGRPLAPGVPEIGSVGDQTVNLTWSAADMQGGTLVKYVITAVETGATKDSTTTAIAFDGLENAKTFHFTVYAVNEIGDGETSAQSNGAIPDRVPDAPINLRITDYQDRQLTLAWDPPTTTANYSPINGYEVNLAGFGIIPIGGPITEYVATQLTNGVDYTFTVRAKNEATTNGGWGASSGTSPSERPSRYPDQPTGIVAVTAGDGGSARVRVTWNAPAVDGGRSITEYRVCSVQTPTNCQTDPNTRQATFEVVTGSENSYTVIAYNSDSNRANSDVSVASNIVLAVVRPGAPTITSVTPDDKRLTVAANVGTNGGCSTTFIEYSINAGATWQTSNVFTGLVNGPPGYNAIARMTLPPPPLCAVPPDVARSSPVSNVFPQTPYGPLGTPTITSSLGGANNTTITWTWNANQGDNGRPWTAAVTGECTWSVGPGGTQTGSCPRDYGYSSGNKTATITVSAPNVVSKTATSTNATPPPPPLNTPTISSSVSGTNITWTWNANQPANATPLWTATIGGECAGSAGPGNQTGSCTRDVGYSSGNRTVTIVVSAPSAGLSPTSNSSTNATGAQPSVSIGLGGASAGACVYGDAQLTGDTQGCYNISITLSNFSGGSHTVRCYHSTNSSTWAQFSSFSGGNGNHSACSYSSAGRWVVVIVDGTTSSFSPSAPTPSGGGTASNVYGQWPTN